jgi:hypothetical protein
MTEVAWIFTSCVSTQEPGVNLLENRLTSYTPACSLTWRCSLLQSAKIMEINRFEIAGYCDCALLAEAITQFTPIPIRNTLCAFMSSPPCVEAYWHIQWHTVCDYGIGLHIYRVQDGGVGNPSSPVYPLTSVSLTQALSSRPGK